MQLTILGDVPSQKNGKQIAFNKSTGKQFVISNKRVLDWKKDAIESLQLQFKGYKVSGYPVPVTLEFYYGSRRRKDLDNGAGGVMDALVQAGVLEDDNYNFVNCLVLKHGGYDKENPRVEIYLDEVR